MSATHDLFNGKVHLYKRPNSSLWQCSSYLGGKNRRVSTKFESLDRATQFAEEWFLGLRVRHRSGELKDGVTLGKFAERFLHEYETLTAGERHPRYVKRYESILRVHLIPFFGSKVLTDITPGLVQDYRIHRQTSRIDKKTGLPKKPSRSELHHETVVLRQLLKAANRHGLLAVIPDLSPPYRGSGKIVHRAWFSLDEYKALYTATRKRAEEPLNPRWKWENEQLHDYVLFMGNTGLRPDESARLEFRDVAIVTDEATGERILEIEVRGKRGVGFCKSMPGAVLPFQRLQKRKRPVIVKSAEEGAEPKTEFVLPGRTDRLFPITHREQLNTILGELGLKTDRDGQRRTAYSLRHFYICQRLMEGADIYQIAKNCRTSVEMIEKFYASHIKNTLDAAAINVRKPRSKRKTKLTEDDDK